MASTTFVPALIIVDMQVDFVTGSLAVNDAPSLIEPINDILSLPFALKVGTKDWHPHNHISFAATHGKSVGEKITIFPPERLTSVHVPKAGFAELKGLEQVLWPVHCVATTPGSEYAGGLNTVKVDATVHKGMDEDVECYSAFVDPWGLVPTTLPALLSQHGVTDVFVTGVAGDFCVKFTAIDAVKFGFKSWYVRDLTKCVSQELAGKQEEEVKNAGVGLVDCEEVKRRVGGIA
ncbi:hypothetical protein SERLA73DRAFT_178877 [Serpula lacrymans var. lacrymans S7.3]|uniref:nicotinamidase n=2 Tax=Serpula lacrymans var. lacrymans TaxID=341189 RepID=F8PT67_SERL3|nr:uncharacterized protein SERLADRAFT_463660 [Serpula lacrymans var. lacrymans S7.9]EGO00897.1 hypothetical protein SERLA73DRAFT_178877 [Serpula lacrymans var. lacrymans S7.3]EGO26512.1 hypothetical protein SERLADRAFT_463660 [Serpula lacrymans var. lacrymans S7.9]